MPSQRRVMEGFRSYDSANGSEKGEKMNSRYVLFALLIGLMAAALGGTASAVTNVTIQSANNSEYNSTTPTIYVTCTQPYGNTSQFNVTVLNSSSLASGAGGVLSSNVTTATPNVSTAITLNALKSPSFSRIAVRCENVSEVGSGNTNDSSWGLNVNARPTISSASATSGFVAKNSPVTFTVLWADLNSSNENGTGTATDSVRLYVCSDNSFKSSNNGCGVSGTELCNSPLGTTGTSTCDYTIGMTDTPGSTTAYAFMVDDNSFPVSSATSISFDVAGTNNEDEQRADDAFASQQAEEVARAQALAAGYRPGSGSGGLGGVPIAVWIIVGAALIVGAYFWQKKL